MEDFIILNSFLALLIIVLPLIIFKMRKRIRLFKSAKQHLLNAPAFSPELVDCYVAFQGRVVTPNEHISTLLHKPCALFQTKVLAEWKTRSKKPDKGFTTNRKTIYSTYLFQVELEANDGTSVHVNLNAFQKAGNIVQLMTEPPKSQVVCPEFCIDKMQVKYKRYILTEKWLAKDSEVEIYAKLKKSSTGRFSLVPTETNNYISVFKAKSGAERKLEKEIATKLGFSHWFMYGSMTLFVPTLIFFSWSVAKYFNIL